MKPTRLDRLPEAMRQELKKARLKRSWSQLDLGNRVGLPQAHISAIETGKVAPRFDTLLDLARTLGHDLALVPRPLVPAVQALIRDYRSGAQDGEGDEKPLYAVNEEESTREREAEQHDEF